MRMPAMPPFDAAQTTSRAAQGGGKCEVAPGGGGLAGEGNLKSAGKNHKKLQKITQKSQKNGHLFPDSE
jgi:hypothetical protein